MEQTIQTLDWIVIAGYILGMLIVGWYFSRKTKTSEDYMLGGRNMKSWMVGMSLFATLLSAISYLMIPGEIIKHGPMIALGVVAVPFTYLIVGYFLIPKIMEQNVSSAYELLEIRLGVSVRILASFIFLVMRLTWMAVIIYLCAVKVVVPITGWSEDAALWISIAMGVITVIYTSMGGLRAVVLTDVVQTMVLLGAAIVVMILIAKELGGFSAWIPREIPETWVRWSFFDPKARVSFMTVFIHVFGWWICTSGSDQMAIQRYLSTRNDKAARKALLTTLICDLSVSSIFLGLLGLGLFAYFTARPDLLPAGATAVGDCADKLFPHFIVIGLPVGITGLVIAGLLAAAMSSLSSGINSSCLSITQDFVERFRSTKFSEMGRVKIARYISFGIGILIVLASLVVNNVRGNLLEVCYKTVNLPVASLFIPFFMTLFVRRATELGTFIGMLAALAVAIMVAYCKELFGVEISFLWILPISLGTGILVSVVLSYLSPSKKEQIKSE